MDLHRGAPKKTPERCKNHTDSGNELPEERSSVERENKRLTSRRLKFASLRQLSQGSTRT
jgi:hypothetical protein